MKNRFSVLLSGIILIFILISSCEQVVYPPADLPGAGDTISYSLAVQPIWDGKCVSCHDEDGGREPYLNTEVSYDELIIGEYIDTASVESSGLLQTLNGTHKSRATDVDRQIISMWISQGAKNN
jgi:predicted CXXCH cytochrome family protein